MNHGGGGSENVPFVLEGMAQLGAGEGSREGVTAEGNVPLCVVHFHLTWW